MLTRLGPGRFRLANTEFAPAIAVEHDAPNFFQVHMSAEALERFPELRTLLLFQNILQLAGEDAGSIALTALVSAPAKIVGVSTVDAPTEALLEFARRRGIEDRLSIHARVSLDDRDRLVRIVEDEFGSSGLQVVLDDVSQDLATGTRAFETLFPRLEPGGSYIIERWSWDHFILEGYFAAADDRDADNLATLRAEAANRVRAEKGEVLEAILPPLVAAATTRPDVVAEVTASRHWLAVRRGPATIDPVTFRL